MYFRLNARAPAGRLAQLLRYFLVASGDPPPVSAQHIMTADKGSR